MAKQEVTVKQYKRKDGTVVRGSTRKLTKAEKLARKQSLGSHLKKGAKIGAAIQGGIGALQGAALGGALAGPVGIAPGAIYGGATGALGGGVTGSTIGGGIYGVKRAMAKKRDPKGFKKSFDYSKNTEDVKMFIGQQDESSINFARPVGAKDRQPRKRGLRTAAKVGAGLAGAAAIGAGLKNRKAIGGAAKAGMRNVRNTAGQIGGTATLGKMAAGDAINSARQKVGGKLQSTGSAMKRQAGYMEADALTGSTGKALDKGLNASNRLRKRGQAISKIGSRISGN